MNKHNDTSQQVTAVDSIDENTTNGHRQRNNDNGEVYPRHPFSVYGPDSEPVYLLKRLEIARIAQICLTHRQERPVYLESIYNIYKISPYGLS